MDPGLEKRISQLFWWDMYVGYELCKLNCIAVIDMVKNLEEGEPFSGVKPATLFKHPPLKGLWHKHYYSGGNVPQNVINQLGEGGLRKIAEEFTREKIPANERTSRARQVAGTTVVNALENRGSSGKLTGEWLIFAKHKLGSLYLSLGFHDAGDNVLFNRIEKHHPGHFPELSTLVS